MLIYYKRDYYLPQIEPMEEAPPLVLHHSKIERPLKRTYAVLGKFISVLTFTMRTMFTRHQ